jgi:predicted DNA binding CopG/RHH family protein
MRKEKTTSSQSNGDELLEHTDLSTLVGKAEIIQGKKAISLRLDQELIDLLTVAGRSRGIGYQTMARLILKEKISEYLSKKAS